MNVKIRNQTLSILIDSGAEQSVLNAKYKHLGDFTNCGYVIKGFNGNISNIDGNIYTKINFGPFTVKGNLAVVQNLNFDAIIGLDLLDSIFVKKCQKTNKIIYCEVNGNHLPLVNSTLDQYICSIKKIDIDAKSQHAICLSNPGLDKNKDYILVKHPACPKSINVLETICKGNNLTGFVSNGSELPITIPSEVPLYAIFEEGKKINNLMSVKDEKSETARYDNFMAQRREKFKPHLQQPNVALGDAIKDDPLKIKEINDLLMQYNMAFAADKMDIGLIRGYRYQVDLKDGAEPWYQPPRRIPPAVKTELTEQFKQELDHNLLCTGNSPYNIPLVIVKKKDGRFRCCLDMRQGNSRILASKYPLPDLHSILTEIGEMIAKAEGEPIYIASFDMNSAYRQLEIREQDVQKFAFTFHNDQFSHQLSNKRMIFGVEDAPSTFSMLMRTILSGLKGTWNYLDDIQVCAVGYENLKIQIKELFDRCIKFGITLEQKKSKIGASQTELLGHIISAEGISVVPGKVEAIQTLPPPKNKDQVRSVVGSFVYFLDFIPNLMCTLAPLYELLRKNSVFRWSNLHQQCFEKAKKDLAECTLRNHRNLKFPLVVVSDASDVGCGAMLGQIDPQGKIQPLQFFSKIFAPPEKRQPIRMRELYAIFYALRKWKSILMAEEFSVLSDHRSLEFLTHTKTNELNVRLFNILYFLGHFSFKVLHVPGRDPRMFTPDMLSRAEYFVSGQDREDENSEYEDPTHVFSKNINHFQTFEILNMEKLRENQGNDKFCLEREGKTGYLVEEGLLYKISNKDRLLVLPKETAIEVAEYCHRFKGHLGSKRLYEFLKTTFYTKKFLEICRDVCSRCTDCISVKYKRAKKGPKPKLLDLETTPFSKVYFDLIDLGGSSANGFRYGVSYQDSLTRYLDIEPIKDKSNVSVCGALLKLFLRYGIPDRAVSDNGKEIIGETNRILYDMLGIYTSHISPLRPQGNLVERAHKQIGELLKLYNISLEKWDIYMPLVLFYYNTAQTEALNGLTPFEALYLRPAKSPLTLNTKNKIRKEWTEQFGTFAENIFTDIAKNHKKRFNAQKVINSDKPDSLKRNQRVLVFKPQPKGTSKKLYRTWNGPFRVVKQTSPGVYQLVNLVTGKRLRRNIDLIRVLPREPLQNKISEKFVTPTEDPLETPPQIESTSPTPETQAEQNLNIQNHTNNFSDNLENFEENFEENIEVQPEQIQTLTNRGRRKRLPAHLRDYILD